MSSMTLSTYLYLTYIACKFLGLFFFSHFHFSLSCIGEGNGNPLQCSCLENPRDGGAWWAAVYEVAQSRTRLKRLSNSSIFPFLLCLLLLFFSQLFVRPPQTTILPFAFLLLEDSFDHCLLYNVSNLNP